MHSEYEILATSVSGTKHKKYDIECQDYCKSFHFENNGNWYSGIGIADGAGSSKFAKIGAEESITHLIELISNHKEEILSLEKDTIKEWLTETKNYLYEKNALVQDIDLNEFSCTILVCIIAKNFGVFFQIGDGAWILKSNNEFSLLTVPQKGEYHNETVFITSKDATDHLQFKKVHGEIELVVGFTDGLEDIFLYANKISDKLIDEIVVNVKNFADTNLLHSHLANFLESELINSRTDDDKTFCIAWIKETIELLT